MASLWRHYIVHTACCLTSLVQLSYADVMTYESYVHCWLSLTNLARIKFILVFNRVINPKF